jgi:DNA-binding transcriptional LysR family regulator
LSFFGDPLFIRAGRGQAYTCCGCADRQCARSPRLLASRARAARRVRRQNLESRFNIAARDAGVLLLAAEVAVRARREAAAVRLHFNQLDRPRIATELASSRLDLALDTPELSSADLEHERIRKEPFVLVMREGHSSGGQAHARAFVELAVEHSHQPSQRALVMRFPHLMTALNFLRATDCVLAAPAASASPLSRVSRAGVCAANVAAPAALAQRSLHAIIRSAAKG